MSDLSKAIKCLEGTRKSTQGQLNLKKLELEYANLRGFQQRTLEAQVAVLEGHILCYTTAINILEDTP